VKFVTTMPGIVRFPPSDFRDGSAHWQTRLSGPDFQRISRTADELGFDALVVSEHLAVPVDLVDALGDHYPHALTAMAFIAGATTRIRLNSMLVVLPLHHPVTMAKAISTLDVMSGGRVTVTFGVGMAEGEFAALGVPFAARGPMTDEYIDAMKVLWSEERPEFSGRFTRFGEVAFEPKPVQRPHPPLWFGGRSLVAMQRAARRGDGWAPSGGRFGKGPWFDSPEELPALLDEIREMRERAGNDRPFDVFLSVDQYRLGPGHTVAAAPDGPRSAGELIDAVGRLADLGVTWTRVTRPDADDRSLEAYLDNLHWVAEEIVPAFR
jgi:probable F420-dependent oxidoreductase